MFLLQWCLLFYLTAQCTFPIINLSPCTVNITRLVFSLAMFYLSRKPTKKTESCCSSLKKLFTIPYQQKFHIILTWYNTFSIEATILNWHYMHQGAKLVWSMLLLLPSLYQDCIVWLSQQKVLWFWLYTVGRFCGYICTTQQGGLCWN